MAAVSRIVEWAGARVPADFGDREAEYRAIREGAALIDLPWYGVVELTGSERVEFLHNLASNEVRNLGETGLCPTALLTVHGKTIADMIVLALHDRLVLVIDGGRAAIVREHLDKYVIADDVEIADRSGDWGFLAISGPDAAAMAARGGLPVPVRPAEHVATGDGTRVFRVAVAGEDDLGVLAPREKIANLRERLVASGIRPAGFASYYTARVEAGIPAWGAEATEDTFPLETRMDDRISTSKGCFLGQETIIRILHRGHVNRKLFGLAIREDVAPAIGAEVRKDGKTIGTVTSAAYSPLVERPIALALVRVHGIEPGTPVEVVSGGDTLHAQVARLPFAAEAER